MKIKVVQLIGCDKCGSSDYLSEGNYVCHPCLIRFWNRTLDQSVNELPDRKDQDWAKKYIETTKTKIASLNDEFSAMKQN